MSSKPWIAALLISAPLATAVRADDPQYHDEGGIRYQVTKQVVQRPITSTHYEPREYTNYRERYTTDMQQVQRTYQVPVTEQQWMPGYQKTWNLLAPPVLSYRLVPVTRWETRTETVRVPVTKRELVPEKQVVQVPVTTQHLAQEEHTHRVAVGVTPGAATASMAMRNNIPADANNSTNNATDPSTSPDDSSSQLDRHR